MGDQGLVCTVCDSLEHRASSCPKRPHVFRATSGYAEYGRWRVHSLFQEGYDKRGPAAVYTLKDQDTDVPSLKRLYLEEADLTEYTFATKYLGGWDHWQVLLASDFVRPHVDKWRTELELKLKAEALKRMIDEAVADGRNAFAANKFLVSNGWVDKKAEPQRRGRPSKADVKAEALRIAQQTDSVDEDFERLMN